MIRWISDSLGTSAFSTQRSDGRFIIDVRELLDRSGNSVEAVKRKVDEGVEALRDGQTVIVCCEQGVSRSNAVAAGILAVTDGIGFRAALEQVRTRTGEREIDLDVLRAVRVAVGENDDDVGKPADAVVVVVPTPAELDSALRSEGHHPSNAIFADVAILDDPIRLHELVTDVRARAIAHLPDTSAGVTNTAFARALARTKAFLDVCSSHRAFAVTLSHSDVFSGYPAGELLATDRLAPRPRTTRGHLYALTEALVENFRQANGLRASVLRAPSVYGNGTPGPSFLRHFLDLARSGRPIVTHRYRNGRPMVELLHVDDLFEAVWAAVEGGSESTLNVAPAASVSTFDIGEYVVTSVGSASGVTEQSVEAEVTNIVLDSSAADSELGWRPSVELWAGLAATIRQTQGGPSQ